MSINKALLKYGYSNFQLEILEYCEPSDVIQREQYYIDLLGPEYNILKTAGSSFGYKHTAETLAKLRGRVLSEEAKANMVGPRASMIGDKNPMFGKTHSEEIRKKIAESMLGRTHSEEIRKKNWRIYGYVS